MKIFQFVLTIILFSTYANGQESISPSDKNTYVFVHGAWGGGWDYKIMEKILEAEGHTVYRPTLTGQGEKEHLIGPDVNLDTHIQDIINVLKFEDLDDVILIGHSYGGMVITGVAHRVPEKIKHLVYADAMLPFDGESVLSLGNPEDKNFFLDLAESKGNGYSIPPFWKEWGKDVPHPLGTFQQKIRLGNPDAEKLPGTYILTIDPGAESDGFSKYAERAKEKSYYYYELRTGHNLQRTMPEEYAEILLKIE
ncbi:MAG: alpha/beta hydrolase [Melioribacteraceae bacterium]|nr:alpha/beta hydrolase [Melioribacteraceae bacterium]